MYKSPKWGTQTRMPVVAVHMGSPSSCYGIGKLFLTTENEDVFIYFLLCYMRLYNSPRET